MSSLSVPKRRCISAVVIRAVGVVVATRITNDIRRSSGVKNRFKASGTNHRKRRTTLQNGHVRKFPPTQQLVHEPATMRTRKRPERGKRQSLSNVEISQPAAQAVVKGVNVLASVEFAGLIDCFRKGVGSIQGHTVAGTLPYRSSETVVAATFACLAVVDGSEAWRQT